MKSEIANISGKLDNLMAQRETEDEGQFLIKTETSFFLQLKNAYSSKDTF